MATNYNITPKQFNGVDYDTLYFKNTSQQSLLNDSTLATTLGLNSNATLNDVLTKILQDNLFGEIVKRTGTGSSSQSSPCSITFTQPVQMVIALGIATTDSAPSSYGNLTNQLSIVFDAENSANFVQRHGFKLGFAYTDGFGDSMVYGKKSNDNKTYIWYSVRPSGHTYDDSEILNKSQTDYYFLGVRGAITL